VDYAILETNGKLSVIKKDLEQAVTKRDLHQDEPRKSQKIPFATELIIDGNVIEKNLVELQLDRSWLTKKLNDEGINDVKEVFYAQLQTNGNLYVDKYEDQPLR
jgi:uncharacterized membrane protein YcaP (DUF421 family)